MLQEKTVETTGAVTLELLEKGHLILYLWNKVRHGSSDLKEAVKRCFCSVNKASTGAQQGGGV